MASVDAEMIAELEALVARQEDPEGFYTIAEWAGSAEVGISSIRKRFRVAKELGRLETRKVGREALDGTIRAVPAYRITTARGLHEGNGTA